MARRCTAVFLGTLALVSPGYAQVDTGRITGIVADESGAVIPGATVRIAGEDTMLSYELKSNEAGLFISPGLRTGRYQVAVEKEGFRVETRTSIEVRVQERVQVNFNLQVARTRTEITVASELPLLESETSSLGQVVEEKQIVELPLNGRNFISLATLGAGTLTSQRTVERDNFIANGARAIQNT